jgi:hypothetical protein
MKGCAEPAFRSNSRQKDEAPLLANSGLTGCRFIPDLRLGSHLGNAQRPLPAQTRPWLMIGDGVMRSVQFKNRNINLAGDLYLPGGFKAREQHPAIVAGNLLETLRPHLSERAHAIRDGNLFLD